MFPRFIGRAGLALLAVVFPCALLAAGDGPKITVLGLFKDKAIVVIDGHRRLLRTGRRSPEGVALITANSDRAVIEFAGRRATYRLGQHIGSTFSAPQLPAVRIWPDQSGTYSVVGSINRYPVDFVVDTGATFISLNGREARRLGIDYRVVGTPGRSTTASGYARIFIVSLKRVKVGEIELRDVPAAIHDGDFPQQVLLGMSFLKRVDMRRAGEALELRRKF